MTDERRFERAARSWLELGPSQAPERVVRAALDEIDSTRQERSLIPDWWPVAEPSRRQRAILALAAVGAVIGILFVLAGIVGSPAPRLVPPTSPTPSVNPSPSLGSSPSVRPSEAPSPSLFVGPAPTAAVGGLTLTDRFASQRYGYSIGMEPGWTSKLAGLTWTGPDNSPPTVDEIDITGTDTTVTGASQALRPGQTFEAWLAAFQPPGNQGACGGGAPSTWPSMAIGGDTWLWQQMCNAAEAIVEHDGRAYVFTWGNGTFDAAQHLPVGEFLELLGSITFDTTVIATPPPAPSLPGSFTSLRNGFSVRYPDGWESQRATGALSQPVPPSGDPGWDVLQSDELRLSIASARLDPGMTADQWARTFCLYGGTTWSPPCASVPASWEPIAIGGATGWIAINGDSAGTYPTPGSRTFAATVVAGGRAYQIWLEGPAERDLFLAILASMQLDPAAASDATPQP